MDRARVAISDSEINAAGIRRGGGGVSTPNPGIGIEFDDHSRGSIYNTTVTGSFAAGISADSRRQIELRDVQAFDNNPNFAFGRRRDTRSFSDDRG